MVNVCDPQLIASPLCCIHMSNLPSFLMCIRSSQVYRLFAISTSVPNAYALGHATTPSRVIVPDAVMCGVLSVSFRAEVYAVTSAVTSVHCGSANNGIPSTVRYARSAS